MMVEQATAAVSLHSKNLGVECQVSQKETRFELLCAECNASSTGRAKEALRSNKELETNCFIW
jgi:hypothetical protein